MFSTIVENESERNKKKRKFQAVSGFSILSLHSSTSAAVAIVWNGWIPNCLKFSIVPICHLNWHVSSYLFRRCSLFYLTFTGYLQCQITVATPFTKTDSNIFLLVVFFFFFLTRIIHAHFPSLILFLLPELLLLFCCLPRCQFYSCFFSISFFFFFLFRSSRASFFGLVFCWLLFVCSRIEFSN